MKSLKFKSSKLPSFFKPILWSYDFSSLDLAMAIGSIGNGL